MRIVVTVAQLSGWAFYCGRLCTGATFIDKFYSAWNVNDAKAAQS